MFPVVYQMLLCFLLCIGGLDVYVRIWMCKECGMRAEIHYIKL